METVSLCLPLFYPQYNPSTIDINGDPAEMAYWIGILQASGRAVALGRTHGWMQLWRERKAELQCRAWGALLYQHHFAPNSASNTALLRVPPSALQDQIPQVVEKAAVSEGGTAEAQRRAAACGKALDLHLTRLRCGQGV